MTPSLLFWLAAAVALLVAEGLTVNLVSIWFAVGAVGGLAASWLGASLLVQFAVFALVSFVCLLVTRPLVRRLRPAAPKGLDADGNLGRTGLVLTPIRPGCEGPRAGGRCELAGRLQHAAGGRGPLPRDCRGGHHP